MLDSYGIVESADSRNTGSDARASGMRGNLLWYVPLFLFVVGYFVIPNARSGYTNVRLLLRHWTWALLFVPSTYVFFSTVSYSVFQPIQFMLFIPLFFSDEHQGATYDRRYLLSFLVVLAMVALIFALQLAIHASFPLCWPADGFERLRMIPFLPCPE